MLNQGLSSFGCCRFVTSGCAYQDGFSRSHDDFILSSLSQTPEFMQRNKRHSISLMGAPWAPPPFLQPRRVRNDSVMTEPPKQKAKAKGLPFLTKGLTHTLIVCPSPDEDPVTSIMEETI